MTASGLAARSGLAGRLTALREPLFGQAGAITAVANTGSVAFHRALGFSLAGPVEDYNGPGRAMLVFERVL